MPKRHSKSFKHFLHGVSFGKTLAFVSVQFQQLRLIREQSVEEFAANCGVSPKFIQAVESCDFIKISKYTTEEYVKVAIYCDMAVDISFKSTLSALKEEFSGIPNSFEDENTKSNNE